VADLEERRSRGRDLRERWKALGRQYEAWVAELKQARDTLPAGAELRTLKPRNLWRNVFHASMGLGCVVAYELFMSRPGLLILGTSVLALFILMDALRRLAPAWNERFVDKVFQKISRPGEAHRIPSATWYVASLTLGTLLLPQHAIEIGALVLALGDPAASLVGRRFGRVKLVGEKSVAGTLALVGVAILAITLFAQLALPGLGLGRVLGIAAAAAAAGALAELFATRLDDNFTIPLAAGIAAMLVL
jgi:dolichol kinase